MSEIMTVVGERTVVKGNLQGDEDLTVLGRVEGGIHLTKTLIIESSGIVLADIEVRDAIISGVVVGNITASNSVQITEEGRMVGDIASPRFIIVDGASFKGHVDMGNLEAPSGERPATPVRPATRVTRPALGASRPAASTSRPAPTVAPSRPAPARPAPSRPAPAKAEPPKAEPKPAPAKAEAAKPASPSKPQAPARPTTQKQSARKPPKPPKMPAGKRKVRRR